MKCKFHIVTHDARFPYACTAMGFKSKRLPQQELLAITGEACIAFAPRPAPRKPRSGA